MTCTRWDCESLKSTHDFLAKMLMSGLMLRFVSLGTSVGIASSQLRFGPFNLELSVS